MLNPSWLTWARAEVGTKEIVGDQDNPRIVEYWTLGKVPLDVNDDETPWCAAFACAALEESGIRSPRTPRARGFLEKEANAKALTMAQIAECRLGAIIVLSSNRGAASGHVGILTGVTKTHVILLGGNQGNRVCEAPFPRNKIVGIMWPYTALAHRNYPLAPEVANTSKEVSDA